MDFPDVQSWRSMDLPMDRWLAATVRPVITTSRVHLHAGAKVSRCRDQCMGDRPEPFAAVLDRDMHPERSLRTVTLTLCENCSFFDEEFADLNEALSQLGAAARELRFATPNSEAVEYAADHPEDRGAWGNSGGAALALAAMRLRLDVPLNAHTAPRWRYPRPIADELLGPWWEQHTTQWAQTVRRGQAALAASLTGWDGPMTMVAPSRHPAHPSAPGRGPTWIASSGVLRSYIAAGDVVATAFPDTEPPRPVFAIPAGAVTAMPLGWHDLGPVRDEHSMLVLTTTFARLIDDTEPEVPSTRQVQALVAATLPAATA